MNDKLTFIGGGNMAHSLIGGLIADGCPAASIHVSDPNPSQREHLQKTFGIQTYEDNLAAIANAATVILAVKPQMMHQVAQGLAGDLPDKALVISIAAGIRATDLDRWLGGNRAIVRCMPNTPALVQSGATGLFANSNVTEEQRSQAESILRAVGTTRWCEEEAQLDAVTALSGSGPAYFFLMMEAMAAAGEELGLDAKTARLLTLQTAFGAAKMALESKEPPATLRERVTSPGGTTEQALKVFDENGYRELVKKALQAANDRSRELAEQLGAQ